MNVFKEYYDHLKKEAESMMHDVMQDEAPHIDELMIIGEILDQIKDIKKIECMEKDMDGEGHSGRWDKE